jgi:membrane-bound ClpP family serine protease
MLQFRRPAMPGIAPRSPEYKGEIWRAVSSQPLQPGQQVVIEKVEGLTPQVAPLLQPPGKERP